MSVIFALVSHNFNEDRSKYLSYVKASGGLGLMLGPSIGSTIYGWLGFARTFYFFSCLLALSLVITVLFVNEPKKVDRSSIIGEINNRESIRETSK